MYKYFQPDTIAVLDKLVAPGKPVNEPVPEKVEVPQVQRAHLDRNQ